MEQPKPLNILQGYQLAASLHSGQKDKSGRPYIEHLSRVFLRVVEAGGDRDQQLAALLHDAIEDGKATAEDLLARGVSVEAVRLVEALTKPIGASYEDYVRSVMKYSRAIMIKRADLEDNSDPERLAKLEPADADRLRRKYAAAKTLLDSHSTT